ncbi:MAG: tyrosine-type recombinase/integrase [Actinobacteria bacterium]|nr:tyrosine-type recombinase/integrase [Actinomycetota bacterium]
MSKRAAYGRGEPKLMPNGYWEGYVSFGTHPVTGKRVRKHYSATSKAEALRRLKALEKLRDEGGVAAVNAGTLAEWAHTWLADKKRQKAPSTARYYASHMKCYILPRLGHIRLEKLTRRQIEDMFDWMLSPSGPDVSVSTVLGVRRTLCACLNKAIDEGLMVKNPAIRAQAPAHDPVEIESIENAHAGAIMRQLAGHRWRSRFLLAMVLGVRQGEALAMRRSAYRRDERMLVIRQSLTRGTWEHGCTDPAACAKPHCKTKPCKKGCTQHTRDCPAPCQPGCTGHARCCPMGVRGGLISKSTKSRRTRTIALTDALIEALDEHLAISKRERLQAGYPWGEDKDEFLFAQPNGRPINPSLDWKRWKQLLRDAGTPHYRLHQARHFSATVGLASGMSTSAMLDTYGWSSPSMIQVYAQVLDEQRRTAVSRIEQEIDRIVRGEQGHGS